MKLYLQLAWKVAELLFGLVGIAWSLMWLYWTLTHFGKIEIIWHWMWN